MTYCFIRERSLRARQKKLLKEEAANPISWWWLSFADKNGFKGGILTRERGFLSALQHVSKLGLNPGGEVRGQKLDHVPDAHIPFQDMLLSKEDIERNLGELERM